MEKIQYPFVLKTLEVWGYRSVGRVPASHEQGPGFNPHQCERKKKKKHQG